MMRVMNFEVFFMLYLLGQYLTQFFGPFRLLTSHLLLIGLGLFFGFLMVWYFLPKAFSILPSDRGRAFAAESQKAKGKPTGAGLFFISVFVVISFLVVPFSLQTILILLITFLTMLSGYLDDRSITSWGEYKKGAIDMLLAVGAALVLCNCSDVQIWLPFTKAVFTVPPIIYAPFSAALLWISINATNCSDGVDGLSGSLVLIALISLGGFLYFVIGHGTVSEYLLIPHYTDGARWAIMAFTLAGCLAGYLWHNAYPSRVLMGDAGSRAIGFFIGVSVLMSGNPFLILIVASMLLVNGGTGLVKVALLRFFKIRIFGSIRFPLHDHFRINRKWSNSQVLIRFAIAQVLITTIFMGLLIKIR